MKYHQKSSKRGTWPVPELVIDKDENAHIIVQVIGTHINPLKILCWALRSQGRLRRWAAWAAANNPWTFANEIISWAIFAFTWLTITVHRLRLQLHSHNSINVGPLVIIVDRRAPVGSSLGTNQQFISLSIQDLYHLNILCHMMMIPFEHYFIINIPPENFRIFCYPMSCKPMYRYLSFQTVHIFLRLASIWSWMGFYLSLSC